MKRKEREKKGEAPNRVQHRVLTYSPTDTQSSSRNIAYVSSVMPIKINDSRAVSSWWGVTCCRHHHHHLWPSGGRRGNIRQPQRLRHRHTNLRTYTYSWLTLKGFVCGRRPFRKYLKKGVRNMYKKMETEKKKKSNVFRGAAPLQHCGGCRPSALFTYILDARAPFRFTTLFLLHPHDGL